jgi:O-antigen/teichoic acid export membrane protein
MFKNKFLSKSTITTLSLQVASIGTIVLSNILLTRWLGDYNFARYSYIVSWLQLLTPVALFGLYEVTLRELSTLIANDRSPPLSPQGGRKGGLVRHFIQKILRETLLFSIFICVLMLALSFGAGKGELYENRFTLLVGLPTVVFFSFIMQTQAILRGYNRATAALLSEKIARPVLIILVVGFYFIFYKNDNSALLAVAWTTVCTFGAALFSFFLLYKTLDFGLFSTPKNTTDEPAQPFAIDRKAQYYFLLLSLLGIAFIRIDALFLGEFGFINDVGVYNTATRFSDLMNIVLQTLTFLVVPQYALLAKAGEYAQLQALVTRTARTTFALTVPLFLGLLCFGHFFLNLHSAAFTAGYPVVVVLGVTNLCYAFLGDSNYLLLMQGHSRTAFACMLLGFACAVGLEIALIPTYGMLGAALGRAGGSLIMYVGTAFMVWRKSGVVPSVVGRLLGS